MDPLAQVCPAPGSAPPRKPAKDGLVAQTASREIHRMRRTPLAPFFSKRAVNDLEPILHEKVERLCSGIRGFMQRREPLNVGVAFTALTLDVITDYCFRKSWNCLSKPDFSPQWKRAMTGLFEPVPVMKQFPWIAKFMNMLPRSLVGKMAPDLLLFLDAKAVSLRLRFPLRIRSHCESLPRLSGYSSCC